MKEAKIMKKNIVQKLFILFAAIGLFYRFYYKQRKEN